MSSLGTKLIALRKEQNITQAKLSKRLGISPLSYSNWEKDKFMPCEENLVKISKYYNIKLKDLVGKKELANEVKTDANTKEKPVNNKSVNSEVVDNKVVKEEVVNNKLAKEPAKRGPKKKEPAKKENVKPEVVIQEVVKPVVAKKEVVKPEVAKTEIVKKEIVKEQLVAEDNNVKVQASSKMVDQLLKNQEQMSRIIENQQEINSKLLEAHFKLLEIVK